MPRTQRITSLKAGSGRRGDPLVLYNPVILTNILPGLPLAPGELEVSGDVAHQFRLSWSPPFTLQGETVFYSLVVTDLDTGSRQTLGPLSDTAYTHQVSQAQALNCHLFLLSVFSLNKVGLSINSSSAPPAIHPSGIII